MNKIKNTKNLSQNPTSPPSQPVQDKPLSSSKTIHVFTRSVRTYQDPKQVEHYWSKLNQDRTITAKTRDQQKIFSITLFVIQKARELELPAQKIRDVYFCRYRSPMTYLTALLNYVPELEDELSLLISSEEIDSRLRVILGSG